MSIGWALTKKYMYIYKNKKIKKISKNHPPDNVIGDNE